MNLTRSIHKLSILFLAVVLCLFAVTACNNNEEQNVNLADNYSLNQTNIELNVGDGIALWIQEKDSTQDYVAQWVSDNPAVAMVQEGVVTAVGPGVTTVKANLIVGDPAAQQVLSLTATVSVKENVKTLNSISLIQSEIEMKVSEYLDMSAHVIFNPSDATNKQLSWFSQDETIVTVSQGILIANAPGTAVITATSVDGGKTAYCTVTVTQPEDIVEKLELSKSKLSITAGKTSTLTAKVTPTDAIGYIVTWTSSDPEVATVADGVVTGLKKGSATITATIADNITTHTATCKVTVTAASSSSSSDSKEETTETPKPTTIAATKVTLDKTRIDAYVGSKDTYQLKATVSPANTTDTVKWTSSNSAIVSVDANGKLTIGTLPADKSFEAVVITCTAGKASEKATIVVRPASEDPAQATQATAVILNASVLNLKVGSQQALTATMTPATATEALTWTSSNTAVAEVSATGIVTAKTAGTAIVQVRTASGKYASCNVTVTAEQQQQTSTQTTAIVLNAQTLNMAVGDTQKVTATLTPATANETIAWSSGNAAVATVGTDGTITAVAKGSATITAKGVNSQKTASVLVIVTEPQKQDIKVSLNLSGGSTMSVNQVSQATVTFTPDIPADVKAKLFLTLTSSNNVRLQLSTSILNLATAQTFNVTARAEGIASVMFNIGSLDTTLSERYNFIADESTLVIASQTQTAITNPGVSIALKNSATTLTLYEGEDTTIETVIQTYNGLPSDDEVLWNSSNQNVAASIGGKIYALKEGTATLSSYLRSNTQIKGPSITVTVSKSVTQTGQTISMTVGSTHSLGLQGTYTCTSMDPSKVTVTSAGVLQAVAPTTTAVQIMVLNMSTMQTTLYQVSVVDPTLKTTEYTIQLGGTQQLTPSTSITSPVWSSGTTTIATVDANGLVKASSYNTGTATITCRDAKNGLSQNFTIRVTSTTGTGTGTGTNNTIQVTKGEFVDLKAKTGFTASYWHTSDANILSIQSNTLGTAYAANTGTVTVIGSGASSSRTYTFVVTEVYANVISLPARQNIDFYSYVASYLNNVIPVRCTSTNAGVISFSNGTAATTGASGIAQVTVYLANNQTMTFTVQILASSSTGSAIANAVLTPSVTTIENAIGKYFTVTYTVPAAAVQALGTTTVTFGGTVNNLPINQSYGSAYNSAPVTVSPQITTLMPSANGLYYTATATYTIASAVTSNTPIVVSAMLGTSYGTNSYATSATVTTTIAQINESISLTKMYPQILSLSEAGLTATSNNPTLIAAYVQYNNGTSTLYIQATANATAGTQATVTVTKGNTIVATYHVTVIG